MLLSQILPDTDTVLLPISCLNNVGLVCLFVFCHPGDGVGFISYILKAEALSFAHAPWSLLTLSRAPDRLPTHPRPLHQWSILLPSSTPFLSCQGMSRGNKCTGRGLPKTVWEFCQCVLTHQGQGQGARLLLAPTDWDHSTENFFFLPESFCMGQIKNSKGRAKYEGIW